MITLDKNGKYLGTGRCAMKEKYNTKLIDANGFKVSFNAPSVLESIRIALGYGAVSYTVRERLTHEIVYSVKV